MNDCPSWNMHELFHWLPFILFRDLSRLGITSFVCRVQLVAGLIPAKQTQRRRVTFDGVSLSPSVHAHAFELQKTLDADDSSAVNASPLLGIISYWLICL